MHRQDDVYEDFAREFIRNHRPSRPAWGVERILVATDFSGCSLTALEHAEDLARALGAEIVLVHVEELPLTPAEIVEMTHGMVDRELSRVVEHLRSDGVRARAIVRAGAPAESIVKTAESERVALIVLGTHGRKGIQHFLLGSVAEQVVREARCPVLTVRPAERR